VCLTKLATQSARAQAIAKELRRLGVSVKAGYLEERSPGEFFWVDNPFWQPPTLPDSWRDSGWEITELVEPGKGTKVVLCPPYDKLQALYPDLPNLPDFPS
jgi:hypothetical protein